MKVQQHYSYFEKDQIRVLFEINILVSTEFAHYFAYLHPLMQIMLFVANLSGRYDRSSTLLGTQVQQKTQKITKYMENRALSLMEIFSGKILFVPDYQRGYAWEESHCNELLEDIEVLSEGFDHYTGTLVLHGNGKTATDEEGKTYQGFDIVDGQQRMTSLVILLKSISDFLQKINGMEALSSGIKRNFLNTSRMSDQQPIFKLTLNLDSEVFFKESILGIGSIKGPEIQSHQRLLGAKKVFEKFLVTKQNDLEKGFNDWLRSFYIKVVDHLKLGIYVVNSSSEVGVIFEVMNNRGKSLTELEKVKNYLLYISSKLQEPNSSELAKQINLTWSRIYTRFMASNLGSQAEEQFFRAHWLMYKDPDRKDWNGSKSVKSSYNLRQFIDRQSDLYNEVLAYVKSLDDSSIVYADLTMPSRQGAFNAFQSLDTRIKVVFWSNKLHRINVIANFVPLLLACRNRFPSESDKYLELVQLIERVAFRMFRMNGKRVDTGQSTLHGLAFQLFHNQKNFGDVIWSLKDLLSRHHPDAVYNSFWEFNVDDNDWYNWTALRYLLYEYEESLAEEKGLHVSWDSIQNSSLENTIEHILPQNPNDPDGYWLTKFDLEDHRVYVHDIGNLCLTYDNSAYRNYPFARKKGQPGYEQRCYANSSLFQERELAHYSEWTVDSVKHRREKIVKWAKTRWAVDLGNNSEILSTPKQISTEVPKDDLG